MSKISRNDPCPCGSGKKYKLCCLPATHSVEQPAQALPALVKKGISCYQNGQSDEASQIFQSVLDINPKDPDGLHLLGVIARDRGDYTEAIRLINLAIQVLPREANFYNNLGICYRKNGQPDQALSCYEKAIQLKPDHIQALNNLGNLCTEQKMDRKAINYFKRAIAVDPLFAEAHFNLGNALQTQLQYQEALQCYQQALLIRPDYVAAISNCGTVLHALKREEEALAYFEQAIEHQADFQPAYMNLGFIALSKGLALEALPFLQYANTLSPDHPETLNFLSHCEKNIGLIDAAIAHAKQAFHLAANTTAGLESAIRLALIAYLHNDRTASTEWLTKASALMQYNDLPARVYWTYLGLLHSWWKRHPEYAAEQKKHLYVLGDSHVLSLHGLSINYSCEPHQGQALWVEGCKQWHLGNQRNNVYKQQFEAFLTNLPAGSAVLICVGEIDCRLNEGLLAVENPGESLADLISATINNFICYLSNLRQHTQLQISISAVPATNVALDQLPHDQVSAFLNLIRKFNTELRQQATGAEMGFLDVFALSNAGEGKADGHYHIDQIHLLPSAYAEAFEKHFNPPAIR